MNISPDGVTVRFTTEPEELFLAEKSGAKPNTVKILDSVEREQLIKKLPEKIIIRHGQEIFLRTVTHVSVSEMILGKYIAIFSWTNVKHIHTMPGEPCPGDHNMSLDPTEARLRNDNTIKMTIKADAAAEKVLSDTSQRAILLPRTLVQQLQDADLLSALPAFISKLLEEHLAEEPLIDGKGVNVSISRNLHRSLKILAHGRSMNSIIQETYEAYLYREQETKPAKGPTRDTSLACIGISREMLDTLTNIAHGRSMDKIIRELYQLYCDKHYRRGGAAT